MLKCPFCFYLNHVRDIQSAVLTSVMSSGHRHRSAVAELCQHWAPLSPSRTFGTEDEVDRRAVLLLYCERCECCQWGDTHRSASNQNKLFSIASAQASTSLFCLDAGPVTCVSHSVAGYQISARAIFFPPSTENEFVIYDSAHPLHKGSH